MIKILKGWFRTAFLVLDFASDCTIGEEAALGGGGGGKDQEKAQSEKDSHSKNRGGKKPN